MQAEKILLEAVEKSQLLDTQESLSCLGYSISELNKKQLGGQSELSGRDVFEARSKITPMQRLDSSKGIIEQQKIIKMTEVTTEIMDKQFA